VSSARCHDTTSKRTVASAVYRQRVLPREPAQICGTMRSAATTLSHFKAKLKWEQFSRSQGSTQGAGSPGGYFATQHVHTALSRRRSGAQAVTYRILCMMKIV